MTLQFFFFRQKSASDVLRWLEFSRLLFRSLDSAAGFVAVRTPAHYLPFSYRRVRILRPIGACVYSYAGFEQSTIGGRERLQINLTIMDTDGVVQIEIEDYVLVRVAP